MLCIEQQHNMECRITLACGRGAWLVPRSGPVMLWKLVLNMAGYLLLGTRHPGYACIYQQQVISLQFGDI
jgi:hypothetical protein